jgi:hypothetical protein
MGSLNNIVNVQISRQTQVPTRAGFGTGAFLSADTTITTPSKQYSSLTEMTEDAAAGADSLVAGAAYFGQQFAPIRLTVIKHDDVGVNEIGALEFSGDLITDNVTTVTLDGVALAPVPFNTSMTLTLDDIATVIQAAGQVTTAVGDSVDGVDITFADFLDHTVTAVVTLGVSQVTALYTVGTPAHNPTITAALVAAIAYSNDWYGLGIWSRVDADIEETSDFIQGIGSTNPKIYFAQNANVDIGNPGLATDIASVLQAKSNFRTSVWYHADDAEYLDMGIQGGQLPTLPGSITWAYKSVSTVTVGDLTDGFKNAAFAKNANTYDTVASVPITEQGKVSDGGSGEWIDVIRGVDWIQVNMSADIFILLISSPKIPYSTSGIGQIQGVILDVLSRAQVQGILTTDVTPVVIVPDIADVSAGDKASRTLNGVTFSGVLAGAIQKINVQGTVTLV